MNWIKIKSEEDLPNFYNNVVVWCKDEYNVLAFACEENGKFVGFKESTEDDYYLKDVTHYHHIVFLPKPEDNE